MIEEKPVFVSVNFMLERFVTAGFRQFCECVNVHMAQGLKKKINKYFRFHLGTF